jgi:hypothetical protein
MATQVTITGSTIGSALRDLLMADEIEPGSEPGYQTAKAIYLYHPLGGKLADKPVQLAQSQQRIININDAPGLEDELRERFQDQWRKDGLDAHIANLGGLSRVYGIATLACGVVGGDLAQPIDYGSLWRDEVYFSVFDPLNTAGSLVLNLNPNAPDFLKHRGITVQGQPYHRSRTLVLMNERPIYLSYTSGAYGFVGRSVYQRPLYPLKTFVQTMITDDLVTRKAGVIVAKLKAAGSMVDSLMQKALGFKLGLVKASKTDNVIGITPDESVESLNLQNLQEPARMAREHVLNNIAAGADMPALMVRDETFTQGFGEGTEDAKQIASYVSRVRDWLQAAYDWADPIIMRRAWNPDFYATVQQRFPEEYAGIDYETAIHRWQNGFRAKWPSLITEPDSELVKVEDTKLKALIAAVQTITPELDPENKSALLEWVCGELGQNKLLFSAPLELDIDALADWQAERAAGQTGTGGGGQVDQEPPAPRPFSAADSVRRRFPVIVYDGPDPKQ